MTGAQDYTVAPPQKASGQDAIMIVVLLVILLFFLLRNMAKFRSDGMTVSRAGKEKTSDDEEEEEEEEEEQEGDEGDEGKDD
eukprot:CAMPEP_0202864164 /NCGR_PEP_ID=MMETSP1391-20130828/4517_1 /ASSEMBLY_ACC=CAM_ASM_000867 /TAXON_ID=1034604 /ORGANISM="Chlamydomonas leiostraca, Strain SAG 11-49" /LENGTH=81 /DNA_ID=CAMNT_0049543879 /DNA_START=96 /DNA_END=341 /DNA_ORIENTATION=+